MVFRERIHWKTPAAILFFIFFVLFLFLGSEALLWTELEGSCFINVKLLLLLLFLLFFVFSKNFKRKGNWRKLKRFVLQTLNYFCF